MIMWDRCMRRLIRRHLTGNMVMRVAVRMQMQLAIMLMHMKMNFFAIQPVDQLDTKRNHQRRGCEFQQRFISG